MEVDRMVASPEDSLFTEPPSAPSPSIC